MLTTHPLHNTRRTTAMVTIAACLWILSLATVPTMAQLDDPNASANSSAPTGQALQATIHQVTGGSVQYSTDGQSWNKAQQGVTLGRDGMIRTGFASTCQLQFGDHTLVDIQPLSSVRVADYISTGEGEKVRANLQYGAIRCGVEKGRVKADTHISTPVSTLAIRGTWVQAEYNPGTGQCLWNVLEHGPAIASIQRRRETGRPGGLHFSVQGANKSYTLKEGMKTDEILTPFQQLTEIEGQVWSTGNARLGDLSTRETLCETGLAAALIDKAGAPPSERVSSRRGQRPPLVVPDRDLSGIPMPSPRPGDTEGPCWYCD